MKTYYSPGVYVEEQSNLAPSVAQVATAIPVFLGYTEKGPRLTPTPVKSLLEYETLFGRAKPSKFKVTVVTGTDGKTEEVSKVERKKDEGNQCEFSNYYAMSLYFQNGGGRCYVISLGGYTATPSAEDFTNGLNVLAKEDEPTLIVAPDAVALLSSENYYKFCQAALQQCGTLRDRFFIIDVPQSVTVTAESSSTTSIDPEKIAKSFRDGLSTSYPSFGAAYYPYIQTSLNYQYLEDEVSIEGLKSADGGNSTAFSDGEAVSQETNSADTMATLKNSKTAIYNRIKSVLGNQRIELPPSAAIAGVYVSVDRDRGVWKTPANIPLASVIGPSIKISDSDQDSLNIDADTGKSINAIRSFSGKGTLVWGGRTLAGNDNEWRYVSVRRLFLTIEESCLKATKFAVFEANDIATWLKVKAMVESYLYGLWEQGALAGAKPEDAYFVNVGLGKTMNQQDVLEGRMKVEIGVAAVRPAEFIILQFSHKLQEA